MPDEMLTPRRPRKPLLLDRSGGANSADAAGADINTIVAQYIKTGTLPNVASSNPLYGDFTAPEDIHSMREIVEHAEDRFMQLPAAVRNLCDNDFALFVDKFDDPEAREELIKAGLKITDEPTPPIPITNSPPPTDPATTTPPDPTPT